MTDSIDNKIDKVLEVLSSGGILYQQLVSGTFLLCHKDGGVSNVEVNVKILVALQERELIRCVSTMREGRSFFGGNVLVYRIAEGDTNA